MHHLNKMARAGVAPLVALGLMTALAACGNPSPATPPEAAAPSAAPGEDTSWFNRGGDLNDASTLEEWRAATTDQRLASAADFLKMKVAVLPAPNEAMQMARTIEAGITSAADSGENGYLGPVVDRIIAAQNW